MDVDAALHRRALIVEDDAAVAALEAELLIACGLDSDVVASAHDALCALAAATPSLVVVDLRLRGGIDGASLVGEIREEFHSTPPILVVSGMFAPGQALYLTGFANVEVLEKPFSPVAFVAAVRRLVDAPLHSRT